MTEGTTRILHQPEAKKVFGQEFYEQHGSLVQPTTPIPPQGNPTARSLEPERKRPNWLLIGSMSVAVLALIAVVILLTLPKRTVTVITPPVTAGPGLPPTHQPPVPPPIIIQGAGSTISPEFIYPGSKITMQVTSSKKGSTGSVLQLQTSDPFDKVVEWYTEKLKPEHVVKPDGSTVILAGEPMKAVINNQGSAGVSILLNEGGD